eukprot:gene1839-2595_t
MQTLVTPPREPQPSMVHSPTPAPRRLRVLLLGAGGAARGVILPVLAEEPTQLVIANRTVARAVALSAAFSAKPGQLAASSFADLAGHFDIVINATSASLSAEVPDLPPALIGAHSFVYDMMYGAQPTVFMQRAAQQGATVRDGLAIKGGDFRPRSGCVDH